MSKVYYSWADIDGMMADITQQMAKNMLKPHVVLGPSRGGLPLGVMLSHYFDIPFHGFEWQTRDGNLEDSGTLIHLLSKYKDKRIVVLTNHTAINRGGKHLIDLLKTFPSIKLKAILEFEHGLWGIDDKRNKEGRPAQYRYASGYAAQFQAHYKGISKKRAVMGMHGRGGQHVVIDFEKSRIVVTNALYEDFNYKKIVYVPIKKGK